MDRWCGCMVAARWTGVEHLLLLRPTRCAKATFDAEPTVCANRPHLGPGGSARPLSTTTFPPSSDLPGLPGPFQWVDCFPEAMRLGAPGARAQGRGLSLRTCADPVDQSAAAPSSLVRTGWSLVCQPSWMFEGFTKQQVYEELQWTPVSRFLPLSALSQQDVRCPLTAAGINPIGLPPHTDIWESRYLWMSPTGHPPNRSPAGKAPTAATRW